MSRGRGKPIQPLYKAEVQEVAACASNETPDDTVTRIKKLLDRARYEGIDPKDAEKALLQANILMRKHNINEAKILAMKTPEEQAKCGGRSIVRIVRTDGNTNQRIINYFHIGSLAYAMAQWFTVKIYTKTETNRLTVNFYGIADNTAAAAHAYTWEFNLISRWALEHKGGRSRNSWCLGICHEEANKAEKWKKQEEVDAKKKDELALAARVAEEEQERAAELSRLHHQPTFDDDETSESDDDDATVSKEVDHMADDDAMPQAPGQDIIDFDDDSHSTSGVSDTADSDDTNEAMDLDDVDDDLDISTDSNDHESDNNENASNVSEQGIRQHSTAPTSEDELDVSAQDPGSLESDNAMSDVESAAQHSQGTNVDCNNFEADFEDDDMHDVGSAESTTLNDGTLDLLHSDEVIETLQQHAEPQTIAHKTTISAADDEDITDVDLQTSRASVVPATPASMAVPTAKETPWESHMQLIHFRDLASEIADKWKEEHNLKLYKARKRKGILMDNGKYRQGVNDCKKIDVVKQQVVD